MTFYCGQAFLRVSARLISVFRVQSVKERVNEEVVSCECVYVVWPISNGVKSAGTFLKIARCSTREILSLVKYQPRQQITKLN